MANAASAGHALRVLTYLASRVEPVAAAHLARHLEIPRSSLYHLLTVLAEHGYVTHYPHERAWGLGPAAQELSSGYQRQTPLQRLARPLLQRVVDSTTHNAHLAVLHGRDVLYVIEERAKGRPLLVTDVGVRLPAPITASGLAMLAALPTRQVTALYPGPTAMVGGDQGGPATPSALRRLLVDVRRRGYAIEEGTVTPGLSSVAHAVLDRTGHPVAAIAITYPSGEVDEATHAMLVASSGATARSLTQRVG